MYGIKASTLAGAVEGLLGLIDNSLMQQIERYNNQCGWLTGEFNLGGGGRGEPAASQQIAESEFLNNYYSLVDATTGVTENYHKEIEKWERDQYDDRELVEITNSFLSEYDLECGGGLSEYDLECGGGGFIESEPEERASSSSGGGINWENLCNQYGSLVGIKDPCYEYANGTELTEKGKTALVCLLGGGVTFLASLDPATKAAILELGKRYCP